MPLIESHSRIAIADENDSAEAMPTHGVVDLAAALVSESWDATPLAKAVAALCDAFQRVLPAELADTFGRVEYANIDALRYGARLGFALARTTVAAEHGWTAWMQEAENWLRGSGCGVEVHQDTVEGYKDEFLDEVTTVAESGPWRAAKPSAQPPAAVESVMQQIADMIGESVDKHERRHHVESPAPIQDPAAPKARPTTVPQEKRQAAGSRAATAPPAHHRLADRGHVAAAVPQLDQCAGDDLELAGHRHPRATDPWFAEHGVG